MAGAPAVEEEVFQLMCVIAGKFGGSELARWTLSEFIRKGGWPGPFLLAHLVKAYR